MKIHQYRIVRLFSKYLTYTGIVGFEISGLIAIPILGGLESVFRRPDEGRHRVIG